DHRVGALDAFAEVAGIMRHAVLLGDFGGGVLVAANQRCHLDLRNALERIEMLLPEGALTGDADSHGFPLLTLRALALRAAACLCLVFALPARLAVAPARPR